MRNLSNISTTAYSYEYEYENTRSWTPMYIS